MSQQNHWMTATIILALICLGLAFIPFNDSPKDQMNLDGVEFDRDAINSFMDAYGTDELKVCSIKSNRCADFVRLDK